MIFVLCLFHFFTLDVILASNGSRGKYSFSNIFRSKKTKIPSIPNEPLTNEDVLDLRPSAPTYFDYLGRDVNKIIFEDLIIEDFASIRLVSKGFRKFFDDFNYALCCELIPGFTKSTFSHWNDEDLTKEYLKYRLIVLTRAILSDYKPLRMEYLKSGIGMHLNTDFHLRRNAVKMIRFFETKNFDMSLKLANAFLNLRIVAWGDIYHLLFSKSPENISKAWELGLTTIAREMAFYHQKKFLESIKKETGNLLKVSNARKFVLFRFMISTARSQSFDLGCIDKCANQLIKSKKWDLLIELFDLNRENVPSFHLMQFANEGNVDGLRALRVLINYLTSYQRKNLVFLAASNGQLEFLQELDAMGLLKEEYYDTIHAATAKGHIECLEFLVSRFGTKYLSAKDEDGQFPIYIAAKSKNPETLRAIIRLSPHQTFDTQHALYLALKRKLLVNAKILIEHFPILINPKSIRLAIDHNQIDFLKYLLENASPTTITVKGGSGFTVLHYAAYQGNWATIIPILLDTGLLNVMERTFNGKTPVAILKSVRPSTPNSVLMKIFKLETREQLVDALRIYRNREMVDASNGTNLDYYFYLPPPPSPPSPISPSLL